MTTAKRMVRAAAIQIAPDLDSADGTLQKVCEAIAKAASQGAELVVFPETDASALKMPAPNTAPNLPVFLRALHATHARHPA